MSQEQLVQFADFTPEEQSIVWQIVVRAIEMEIYDDSLDCDMDLGAVCFHTPLRLNDLLNADNFNFAHDMRGIQRHINRTTGQLENFFLPRFAK